MHLLKDSAHQDYNYTEHCAHLLWTPRRIRYRHS